VEGSVPRKIWPVHAGLTVTIGTARLGVGKCTCLHHRRIAKRRRRLIDRVPRDRGLAHLDERPVDEIGIRIAGRDVKKPAKEKDRHANAPEDRQQADQRQELKVFMGKVTTGSTRCEGVNLRSPDWFRRNARVSKADHHECRPGFRTTKRICSYGYAAAKLSALHFTLVSKPMSQIGQSRRFWPGTDDF